MPSTAILFPGQGAQESGMGRELAEVDSFAVELWKKAERISAKPLREIYWEGDEAAMADTASLQPALTVVNLALWNRLSARLKPFAAAGHSLGEYCALAASGVLGLDDVLQLVSLRGKLMAEADPERKGAMSAVLKLGRDEVEEIVRKAAEATGEVLVPANYNTPTQLIISGTATAVSRAAELAKEKKARVLPLKVSGAFHSPLMRAAADELSKSLKKVVWSKPRFPVYSNARAKALYDGESVKEAMLSQMTSPVKWTDLIRNQWLDGIRVWVEVGPKELLSKMVKPNLEDLADKAGDDSGIQVANVNGLEQAVSFAL